jgi:hypothetical protein
MSSCHVVLACDIGVWYRVEHTADARLDKDTRQLVLWVAAFSFGFHGHLWLEERFTMCQAVYIISAHAQSRGLKSFGGASSRWQQPFLDCSRCR